MTPERLTEIEQLVAGGIVYLKPATAKDLIAHIRDLEAQLAACDIGWISWLSEGNRKAFLQGLGDWKATAERDEFLRHQPSPEVDYRREGEHGRSLPNNWPSPEVGGMKSGLTTLDLHLLDKACIPVWAAFQNTYLVGTAQTGGEYRDVDVRTILKDEEFDRLFGGESQRQLWELICVAVGHLLSQQTGLPIDYQIQRMSEANAKYDGPRNPIGRKRQYAAWGDATPWALQPPSPEVGE